jgi:hypothetical protein
VITSIFLERKVVMWLWLFVLAVVMFSMYLAADVGDKRNCSWLGFLAGLFFGPLGIIVAGFLENRPQCQRCGSRLNIDKQNKVYSVCPHCQWENK